jgi:hypothetical protein
MIVALPNNLLLGRWVTGTVLKHWRVFPLPLDDLDKIPFGLAAPARQAASLKMCGEDTGVVRTAPAPANSGGVFFRCGHRPHGSHVDACKQRGPLFGSTIASHGSHMPMLAESGAIIVCFLSHGSHMRMLANSRAIFFRCGHHHMGPTCLLP